MTTNRRNLITVAIALTLWAILAGNATAQCCGATTAYYAPAYTAAYAPAYTSYYAPTTYTTAYSGGWYPGYFVDRIRTRLWGSPTGYVAAYPATYSAAYAPSTCSSCQTGYVAAYAP